MRPHTLLYVSWVQSTTIVDTVNVYDHPERGRGRSVSCGPSIDTGHTRWRLLINKDSRSADRYNRCVYSDADGAVSRPTGCWGCFGTFLWCGWERFGIQLEDRILVTLELLCMFLAIGEVYCHRIVKYLLIDDFKEKSITRCTNYEGCQNSNVLEISFCRKGCENPPALWLALLVNVENANLIDGISRK